MKKLSAIFFTLFVFQAHSQMTFDTSQPIDSLIQDFVGSGITLSNVTFAGGAQSIGSFNGSTSIGSTQGIVFTTGNVDSMINHPAIDFLSESLSMPGDADLSSLVGVQTYDASVLEFDFVATNTTLLFDYVFASEEYNEYVGSSFNDVFAFFISGPGITGHQNIALVPSTTIPVAINYVNNGSTGAGPCMNCAYFHDNTNDTTIAFDGFTVPLTATYTLTPGQTYHLKLCVADAADGVFDTGVFLQKYSLRSENPAVAAEIILDKTNVFIYDKLLHINLAGNVNAHCVVYGIDGKKVMERKLTELNNTFNMDNLMSGIYSVVIDLNGKSLTKKVILN